MMEIWNVCSHYCQLASLVLHTNEAVVWPLLLLAIFRLFFSSDKLFKFSFAFRNRWMQRVCRLMIVAVVIWELIAIYQGLPTYVADTNIWLLGALSLALFFLGVWMFWWLVDAAWLIVLLIFGTIKRFFSWLW